MAIFFGLFFMEYAIQTSTENGFLLKDLMTVYRKSLKI
jgi:hypothetical protein